MLTLNTLRPDVGIIMLCNRGSTSTCSFGNQGLGTRLTINIQNNFIWLGALTIQSCSTCKLISCTVIWPTTYFMLIGIKQSIYMFRANCKFAQFRNCVTQLENFEIAYRFRNCPPILKLPPNFEIALRNFEIA